MTAVLGQGLNVIVEHFFTSSEMNILNFAILILICLCSVYSHSHSFNPSSSLDANLLTSTSKLQLNKVHPISKDNGVSVVASQKGHSHEHKLSIFELSVNIIADLCPHGNIRLDLLLYVL